MASNQIPTDLVTRILDGKCVLFLGAGATVSSGGAIGSELGKFIASSIGDVGIKYTNNLAEYTQLLVNKGYRNDIERIIRDRFARLTPSKSFAKLAILPWKAIYTTNYDDLIEKSYSSQSFYNCVVETPQTERDIYGQADIKVYKIHGDINSAFNPAYPLIVTLNDLRDSKGKRKHILRQLMRDLTDTFVFVGYSFQDENEIVTKILDELSDDERWESVKEKYAVLPSLSTSAQLTLESYKISHIPCSAEDFFESLSKTYQESFFAKLRAIGRTFENNDYLKAAEPRVKQYIIDCFDVFDQGREEMLDARFFYRGGTPNWSIVKGNYDIPRLVTLTRKDGSISKHHTDTLYHQISLLPEKSVSKVIIRGAAASGKTTLIYRLAYDLFTHGFLSLVFRQQAKYKEGLLSGISDILKSQFFVLIDNIFIDAPEIRKMINEAEKNSLPVVFIMATRNSDWSNKVGPYYQNVFEPFDLSVDMSDTFDESEAEGFFEKLVQCKLISVKNDYEKKGIIREITQSRDIVDTLLGLVSDSNMRYSIADEYAVLQPETQFAYGLISLVYRYGFKLRWEILQRTIASKYSFSWEDFVNKVLKCDAGGNLSDEIIQGNYYILARNRRVCEIVVSVHFNGCFSSEIEAIKHLIYSCAEVDCDERFMCSFLNALLKENSTNYSPEQLVSLVDCAINSFKNDYTKSLLTHIKGEFLIKQQDFEGAIECFESNVRNELNEEYSLHSLGKTYFYIAQNEMDVPSRFRLDIDSAVERLFAAIERDSKNPIHYGMLISIFAFLHTSGKTSEKDEKRNQELIDKGRKALGVESFDKMLQQWSDYS